MVLSLSSDGFFQITQRPDVHLVGFQKKYASLYVFQLAFSDVFTAMHLQLRIFWLGFGVLFFFYRRVVVLIQQ